MNRSPAFQFYPNDWLSSLKIALMSPAEEGAYIRLLCYAWADLDCSLPDDDTVLAQLSRLGEGWLNGGSTVIRKCFEAHPEKEGRLVNMRLLEERRKQEAWREKSRIGGLESGKSRALSAKGGSRVVEPKANRPVEGCMNPSSSSSSSNKNKKEERAPVVDLFSVSEVLELWNRIPGAKLMHLDRLTPNRGLHKRITTLTIEHKRQPREWWTQLFAAVDAQKLFLFSGQNDRGWIADLVWVLSPENLAKVLERRYEHFKAPRSNGHARRFELERIPV
jgi:uncharacterized protein YdaU (DUF1376 family)